VKQVGSRALQVSAAYLLHAGSLLGLFFDAEDGSEMFLRKVGWFSTDYTAFIQKKELFITAAVKTSNPAYV
jgi:hypothetical protein